MTKIKSNKNNVFEATWFTILMLVLFFPVGLFTMFKYKKFNKAIRGIIALICLFILISPTISIAINNIYNKKTTPINTHTNITTQDIEGNINENISVLGKVVEKSVINGSGTEIIGTRAEINYIYSDITKEEFLHFYNDTVKNGNYNWITINLNNGKSIQFIGTTLFQYGNADNEGRIIECFGDGYIINDNDIKYEAR